MTVPKKKIIVTRRLPERVQRKLAEHFDPVFNELDVPMTSDQISDALCNCDGLLPTVTDKVDGTALQGPIAAKIIANYGVGYSHIDIDAARTVGLCVTNTPDVLSECTADIAMTLMLMCARRAGEGERELRAGRWAGWRPTHLIGAKLSGKTLGIVGFGRIGQETAKRANHGFGMKVIVQNRSQVPPDRLAACAARQVQSLDELLAEADFVSLHCPGGHANQHLINAKAISAMKPGSFLINSARGEGVDDIALAEALQNGHLGGAGLDVFDGEPKIRPELLACDNAVLLPHLGSATAETRDEMGFRAIDNLIAFFDGKVPPDRIV